MSTWVLIVLCIFCWGSWAVAEKLAAQQISPLMMQIIKAYAYSALAPILFMYMKVRNDETSWNHKGVFWTLVSFTLATIASISFAAATQRTHAHLVTGMTSSYPVLTFLLCAFFLGEPVTMMKLVGIAVIVLGTIIVTL